MEPPVLPSAASGAPVKRAAGDTLYFVKRRRAEGSKPVPDMIKEGNLLRLYQRCWGTVELGSGDTGVRVGYDGFDKDNSHVIVGRPEVSPTPHCHFPEIKEDFMPDHYLRQLLLGPRKTYPSIKKLSNSMLQVAFTFRPGSLPGAAFT